MRCLYPGLVLAAGLASAQAVPQGNEYAALNARISFRGTAEEEKTFKLPSPDVMDGITSRLHDMVTSTIQQALSEPNASSSSVQKAMLDLQGEYALSWHSPYVHGRPGDPNVPFADLRSLDGTPVALATFAVMGDGADLAYLQFYANLGGVWKLQSELGSEFNGTRFSVAPVDSAMPNEVRYVVWGSVYGSPDGLAKVSVYSFNGLSARAIWERSELTYLKVTVSGDQVTLDHDVVVRRASGAKLPVPPKHLTEVMRSTPSGILLESSKTTNSDN